MELSEYYMNYFPFQLIYRWLNYKDATVSQSLGDKNTFQNREISFMLSGNIYVRFQSYTTWSDFKKDIVRRAPLKIDAGAVYNDDPRKSKVNPFIKAQQRELVFDIDISDYNDVRYCCSESNMCPQCWPLMKIGAKVLYHILTRDFGFKHILLVYSGRRGFHCWVSDKRARLLDNRARSAITSYLKMIDGGINLVKRVRLSPATRFHPMVQTSLDVIDKDFEDVMVVKQDFLSNENRRQNFIDLVEDFTLKAKLNDRKKDKIDSQGFWAVANQLAKTAKKPYFIDEIKIQSCYPRLDENVTKGLNHLLKLPFCVHPNTNNICVPFDIDMIDTFDPFKTPKIDEPDAIKSGALEPFIQALKKFVDKLEADNLKDLKKSQSNNMDV